MTWARSDDDLARVAVDFLYNQLAKVEGKRDALIEQYEHSGFDVTRDTDGSYTFQTESGGIIKTPVNIAVLGGQARDIRAKILVLSDRRESDDAIVAKLSAKKNCPPNAQAAAPVNQAAPKEAVNNLVSPLTGKPANREEQADLEKLQALYNSSRQAEANLKSATQCGGNIKAADTAFHTALNELTGAVEQYVRDYSDTLFGPKLNPAGHAKLESEKSTLGEYLVKHGRSPVEANCREPAPIPRGPSAPPKFTPMPAPHPPM